VFSRRPAREFGLSQSTETTLGQSEFPHRSASSSLTLSTATGTRRRQRAADVRHESHSCHLLLCLVIVQVVVMPYHRGTLVAEPLHQGGDRNATRRTLRTKIVPEAMQPSFPEATYAGRCRKAVSKRCQYVADQGRSNRIGMQGLAIRAVEQKADPAWVDFLGSSVRNGVQLPKKPAKMPVF
jgi:hypothetical protein